ncbi:rod shape-determining protein MreC [compost metagenome]
MGQRFPAGYPVATVKEVIHDSGQPFAIVRAVPTAALNRSRYMLLVFTDTRSPEERANDAARAQEAADREAAVQPADGSAPAPSAQAAPAAPAVPAAPAAPATTPAAPVPAAPVKPPAAQNTQEDQ